MNSVCYYFAGEIGKEMYIVNNGKLQVVTENGKLVLATLGPGSYFGEACILNICDDFQAQDNNVRRTASVRSVGYSDLFGLSRNDLADVLKDYPCEKIRLRDFASRRLQKFQIKNEQPNVPGNTDEKKISTSEALKIEETYSTTLPSSILKTEDQPAPSHDKTQLTSASFTEINELEPPDNSTSKDSPESTCSEVIVNTSANSLAHHLWSNQKLKKKFLLTKIPENDSTREHFDSARGKSSSSQNLEIKAKFDVVFAELERLRQRINSLELENAIMRARMNSVQWFAPAESCPPESLVEDTSI